MTGVNIFGKKRLSSSFYCDGFDMTENTNNILLLFQLYRYWKGLMSPFYLSTAQRSNLEL